MRSSILPHLPSHPSACIVCLRAEEASDLESSDGGGYDPEGSTFAGSRRRQQDWDSDAGSSEED